MKLKKLLKKVSDTTEITLSDLFRGDSRHYKNKHCIPRTYNEFKVGQIIPNEESLFIFVADTREEEGGEE